jgi:hypothetical protein
MAMISQEGMPFKQVILEIGEKPSTFSAKTILAPGNYEILVYAYDPLTGNTGVDRTNIIVN